MKLGFSPKRSISSMNQSLKLRCDDLDGSKERNLILVINLFHNGGIIQIGLQI